MTYDDAMYDDAVRSRTGANDRVVVEECWNEVKAPVWKNLFNNIKIKQNTNL